MSTGVRYDRLYHGTTLERASIIVNDQTFAVVDELCFASRFDRDLAVEFARRKCRNYPRQGGPALVLVSIAEEDFTRLRTVLKVLKYTPFDPDDAQFANRRQWKLDGGYIEQFNQLVEEWELERI